MIHSGFSVRKKNASQKDKAMITTRTTIRTAALTLAVLAGIAGLSACASYAEKDFTADDTCRDCGDKGGIFSGDDGKFTYGW